MKFSKELFLGFFNKNKFFNYRFFNRKPNNSSLYESYIVNNTDIAILIQGPIMVKDDFTINSLIQYRTYYPNIKIYLSTWNIRDVDRIILQKNNIKIITNHLPKNPGIFNINLQIETTSTGIKYAKKDGCKFILKTRTDQRINHPGFIAYFVNLINLFPPFDSINQKFRLICCSLNTLKFRYYGISDMLMFGEINDMDEYWNIKHDNRTRIDYNLATKDLKSYSMCKISEVYLCTKYLEKKGIKMLNTLQHYFEILRKYFIVIDSESILLYWNKYTCNIDRYSNKLSIQPQITFQDWLIIYSDTNINKVEFSLNEESMYDNGI